MGYIIENLKILGQSSPVATVLTDIYTVPGGKDATVSSIVVCNRDGNASDFSISIAAAGAVDNVKQYIYYTLPIPANETFIATVGFTLSATDIVRVKSTSGLMSFNIFGSEIS